MSDKEKHKDADAEEEKSSVDAKADESGDGEADENSSADEKVDESGDGEADDATADAAADSDADGDAAADSDGDADAAADSDADGDSDADADSDADGDAAADSDADAGDSSAEDEGPELYGLLAQYDTPGELIAAAEKVRDAGFTEWDCYSPFPVHGIDPAMGIKRTILPWIVFIVGLGGLGGGLLLQWWANAYNWPWIISGKPFFSIPANIPITFETTVLAAVLSAFFGMWILNRLPQVWHPFFKKDRFLRASDDGFFIGIQAADDKFRRGKTEALLSDAGASVVETCYWDPSPEKYRLPKPVTAFIIISAALALVPVALIAKARADKTTKGHIHIIPDMDFQPKAKSQTANPVFADDRASRPGVSGTIARGELKADDHFYRGIQSGRWATALPASIELSARTMARGQNRYTIYCQPCHGADGRGDGMINKRANRVPKRGWVKPADIHQAHIVKQPHGQIYNTISNGIRTMPGYSAQIAEADRWAIVLYMRALQRSQNTLMRDVPPDARQKLQ